MDKQLGKLIKADLREAWSSESSDFTPWLAQPENLKLLGDEIGIELELEATEKDVGPFSADILCKDTVNAHWVVIENQLEKTDHKHLGQLLTYGAGLKAATIIWISAEFTDEHRAALDWLNEISDERIVFLGVEVELWQIGTSLAAPKFNIVSKPNEWSRDVAAGASQVSGELTEAKKLQLHYWGAFREFVLDADVSFKPTKPLPQNWMNISIGRSGFNLSVVASMYDSESNSYQAQEIRAEMVITGSNSKVFYNELKDQSDVIDSEFGESLTWYSTDNAMMCRIFIRMTVDLFDESDWLNQHKWLMDNIMKLRSVFYDRILEL